MKRNEILLADICLFSMLKIKLVSYLPQGNFTDIISEFAVPKDKLNWVQPNFTATYYESEKFNFIIHDKLPLNAQPGAIISYVGT